MAECSLGPDEVGPKHDVVALDIITFLCPLQPTQKWKYYSEDILVTVNFTMLNITANLAAGTRWNSVQVFLGGTHETVEVVRRTPPTSLIPGVNLIGFVQPQVRQQFYNSRMSAFGVLDVSKPMNSLLKN